MGVSERVSERVSEWVRQCVHALLAGAVGVDGARHLDTLLARAEVSTTGSIIRMAVAVW